MTFALRHARSGETIDLSPRSLIIAGFTGRDQQAVAAHIEELEKIGVPCPSETPTFYPLPAALLTTGPQIAVGGGATSGEVEPVLFCVDGRRYIGVGSDHTDRDLERTDIAQSKAACPKIVGSEVLDYDEVVEAWDALRLRSATNGGAPYQDGVAGELLPVPDVLDVLRQRGHAVDDGDVVFLGTLPLKTEGFVFSDRWSLELQNPDGVVLRCTYEVVQS